MREDGASWGIKATTGEVIAENRTGVWLTRKDWRKTARERLERGNLEMTVVVRWRKNEDDAQMDGEHLKREVLMMDKGNKDKPEMEEHVLVPKRVNITHEGVEVSGSTARWLSLLKETGREAHTECCRRRIEEELRGTVEAEAVQRLAKEYLDKAAER